MLALDLDFISPSTLFPLLSVFFPLVLVVFCFPWLLFQKGMANGLQIKSPCPRDIKNSFLRKEIERVELDSTLMRATWKWI